MKLKQLFESQKLYYHGTSEERWVEEMEQDTSLYLTADLDIARHYAKEWKSEGQVPLVLGFTHEDLVKARLRFDPNWETVEQHGEEMSWEDSLKRNATFSVYGNIEKLKDKAIRI